ncbi:MAG: hypothetical protein M5U15_01310 [Kiritimatiellae bacterium]|nr:hypothetical protein [Kiritimatiellia bacterium]
MKTTRYLLCMLAATTTLFAAGCATVNTRHAYSGKQRDAADLALVLGTTQQTYNVLSPSRSRISVMSVDDDSTVPWYSPSAYPTAVYVLPGRHKLDMRYEHVHGVADGSIWVDALTNRTYQVKVMNPEGRTTRVYFVVEDITAQTLVGGEEGAAAAQSPTTPAPATAPTESGK